LRSDICVRGFWVSKPAADAANALERGAAATPSTSRTHAEIAPHSGGIAFGIEGWLHWNQLSLVAVIGHVSAAYQPAECAMLYGVAVIVTALVVSTLAAVVVDTTYRAISERH
jgi:hypothetical protein